MYVMIMGWRERKKEIGLDSYDFQFNNHEQVIPSKQAAEDIHRCGQACVWWRGREGKEGRVGGVRGSNGGGE